MKMIQFLSLFLCAAQLAASTEFDKEWSDGRYQQEKDEIFQENVQEFKEWLRTHDEQFTKHSCLASCDESCKVGIVLVTNVVGRKCLQPYENITLSDMMLPNAGHHMRFVNAKENGIDFCSQNTKLSEEPTKGTNDEKLIDENKNVETQSSLADWVLDMMYGFRDDSFDEKRIIKEYKTEVKNIQEKHNNFYKASRCTNISEYIEEYRIKLASSKRTKNKLYKKLSNTFKTALVAEKKYIDVKEVEKKHTGQIKKMIYRKEKTGFGNERKAKKTISLFCKFERIETILRDIHSLKPAALKEYLKEYKFENISPNWKKQQLVKKLSGLLNDEREALLKKINQADEKEKISSSNKSKLMNVGDDMYITEDGDYVYLADGTAGFNILFDIDEIITKFVCNKKTYLISNICGMSGELKYLLECSDGLEMMYIFSYSKIGEANLPNVGNVVVVGGKPYVSVFVQITGSWHERKNVPVEQLQIQKELCWTREARKRHYESKV